MGLTIAITGAGGFIGRATIAAALRRGHAVVAITRSDSDDFGPDVARHVVDLARDDEVLAHVLAGVDAVIHAAGSMRGDAASAARDTVLATQTLLAAMARACPAARLVLVSSIAVYDADAREITEDTPPEPRPARRDIYAQAKLAQEAALADSGIAAWIARPGAVFGPDRAWNAHLGHRVGPLLMRLGGPGQVPVLSRESCAEALVYMAETPLPDGTARPVNLVESDLPTRARYLAALGPAAPRLQLPFPWRLLRLAGALLGLVPGLRARLPGLLQPRSLRARFGAKTYSNARAEADLPWRSRQPFENALRAALEGLG